MTVNLTGNSAAASAMIGEKGAMTYTIEVENIIEKHYTMQEEKLKSTLMKFRYEDLSRQDTRVEYDGENAPWCDTIGAFVKLELRTAIKF